MSYTIYKSTDPDAPQMSGRAGDAKAVLKACLITGYGSGADKKEPAGWAMPFEDGNKAVFQPIDSGGENLLIRVDNSQGYNCRSALYESMTGIDSGIKKFDCNLGNAYSDGWFMVATVSWCWLFITAQNSTYSRPFFMGNIQSILPENKNKTVLGANKGSAIIFNSQIVSNDGPVYSSRWRPLYRDMNLPDSAANDFIWADILLSTDKRFLGTIPLVKMVTKNSNLGNWHEIAADTYALKLLGANSRDIYQAVMDFNDVV